MKEILTKSITELIESDVHLKGEIGIVYDKVRSHLDHHARKIGLNHKLLTLLHTSNERGEASPALARSIEGRPKKSGATQERHDTYTGEILSCIKRINLAILKLKNEKDLSVITSSWLNNLPESVWPIYDCLPRDRKTGLVKERSLDALLVIVNVARKHDTQSPEDILLTHQFDLTQELYVTINEPAKWNNIFSVFSRVKEKLGLTPDRLSAEIPFDSIPPKLKPQYQTYLDLSPTGAHGHSDLIESANRAQYPLVPHAKNTRRTNNIVFLLFLGELIAAGYDISDVDITDFMKIETISTDDGEVEGNKYIEFLRESQRKQTHLKAAGCDSNRFIRTLEVIPSISSYNGVFKYHKQFKKVYEPYTDCVSFNNRKKDIKEWFTPKWLDGNLIRLGAEFEAIIESKSFRTNIRDLWLCQFYVWTMALRYSAIRHQCIRNCRKNWNIYFEGNAQVRFRWREDEIKNDKDFVQTFKMSQVHTFKPLVEALIAYKKHILPFLEKLASRQKVETECQFFLKVSRGFKVSVFDKNDSRSFGGQYKFLSRKFLDFTDIPAEMRSKFNARLIRGLASDWAHDDLGIGVEPTSQLLGNTRRTTERDYLQRNRVDATMAIDEAEGHAAARKERESPASYQAATSPKKEESAEVHSLRITVDSLRAEKMDLVEKLAEEKAKNLVLTSTADTPAA